MGWGDCGDDDRGRPIGYMFEATCDEPQCNCKIDRGLSYVCGSMHGGGEYGCGGYFCTHHLRSAEMKDGRPNQLCVRCYATCEAEGCLDDS